MAQAKLLVFNNSSQYQILETLHGSRLGNTISTELPYASKIIFNSHNESIKTICGIFNIFCKSKSWNLH